MEHSALHLRLFSRSKPDPRFAVAQLDFLSKYGRSLFQPDECGRYEPYEPFDTSQLDRYALWISARGEQFGFRRFPPPLEAEGSIANLQYRDFFVTERGSDEPKPLPPIPDPALCLRWSLWITGKADQLPGPELMRDFLCEACRITHAEYGFVADAEDYRNKNFVSIRTVTSIQEKYVGDDPQKGIPGLYWMNYFGRIYVQWFGEDKIAQLSEVSQPQTLPDGALYVQFGNRREDSLSESILLKQRRAMGILGGAAFFDIEHPDRVPDVPPELRTT